MIPPVAAQEPTPGGTIIVGSAFLVQGRSTMAATGRVVFPRIRKIAISGYRAFPPYKPSSLEIDLGDTGKNLLLYGENGSGKTSLFRALRDLFDISPTPRDYATVRNIFHQDEDDSVVVSLTSGTPDEYRWEVGEPHPKTIPGSFHAFARTCLFLEYRDLLQTNFVHHTGAPNLFDLLVNVVLPELPAPARPLKEALAEMRDALPRGRRTKNPIRRANQAAERFRTVLSDQLPELVRETNRLLAALQPRTIIQLTPPTAITYDKSRHDYNGRELTLGVELNGQPVTEPQHFLNEARLTAIALALYLAAARLTRVGRPGIMVLDDVLIGLDLSNRIPLLKLIQDEFADWQILLLTHDATWFDMAENRLNEATWSFQRLHNGLEPGTGRERPIHIVETGYLERAEGFLLQGDYPAAGVYLRSAFEALLRDFACEKRIPVPFKRELRELNSEHLWPGVKTWSPRKGEPALISTALAMEIDFCRRFILNPLCHEAAGRPNRGEAELALSSLKQLKIALESADSWRTAWDQLHPKGHALPQSWHLALCEWLLSKTPKSAVCDCGAAIREAFIVALDSYNQRHRASITYSADSYVTRRIQWEAAKIASLAAAQPAFVALIEANASWLLNEAPSATDWGAVTEVQTTSVFDGLRDGTKGQRISCALSTW